MNKSKIDKLIPIAYKAIKNVGISDKNGKVVSGFKGQIATFGAAISSGSLKAAVCFFSEINGSKTDRTKILDAIYEIIKVDSNKNNLNIKDLRTFIFEEDNNFAKEQILNAAIAIKLSLNLYKQDKSDNEENKNNGASDNNGKQ